MLRIAYGYASVNTLDADGREGPPCFDKCADYLEVEVKNLQQLNRHLEVFGFPALREWYDFWGDGGEATNAGVFGWSREENTEGEAEDGGGYVVNYTIKVEYIKPEPFALPKES